MIDRWRRAVAAAGTLIAVATSGTAAAAATQGSVPSAPPTVSSGALVEAPAEQEAEGAGRAAGTQAAAAPAQSQVGITKESSLDGSAVTPGSQFSYILTARCSGLTAGCVNQTVTDVLPAGLDVTSLPPSTDTRVVEYDAATRTLTVRFEEPLQEPVGSVGLNDGATRVLEIGMRLPASTSMADGAEITNTATTVADNAPSVSADNVLPVSVPREVRPVSTKVWTDGSAIAGGREATVVLVGVRNASSSSASVRELRITDATPGTFENFDLTGAELVAFPAGADRARLLVCREPASACGDDADWTAGPTVTATGTLALPDGIAAGDVTGVRVVFTAASGDALPYDATGGSVRLGLVLRDTVRSTGDDLAPTTKLTIDNCAVPGAVEENGDVTAGTAACDTFDVLPDTVVVHASKTFIADTDGSFGRDNGEYAVVGQRSPVSATVAVRNDSAFPLRQVRITEPDAGSPVSEFEKLDVTKVRLRFPTGATSARLVVTYADGSADLVRDLTATAVVDVARPGTRPTSVEVQYTGVDANGPSIAVGATSYLDLHGTLNDGVTAADLASGTSPGVGNCAAYRAQADVSDSTGTTSGNACAVLSVESRRSGASGVKTVGQRQVPPGQPIPFTMTMTNNGNVALVDPVLSDPPVDADGRPRADANPFAVLSLVSATVRKDSGTPSVDLEVFDPVADAWVPYAASDAALLARSLGVRALVDGELTPTKRVFLDLVTQRRSGVADDVQLSNCFAVGAVGFDGDPACSAELTTAPASSGAVLNKSITPGRLPAPIPGVPQQTAQVRLTVANTGNVSAKRIQVTDDDAAFFDAVDFGRIASVTFPVGANRVQVDARTAAGWVSGTPVASAASYALPAGVAAADVVGVRATFTNSDGGYSLRPCEGTPTPASCTGAVVFDVHPRGESRSDAGAEPARELENTASAGFETRLQAPGTLAPVDPVEASLDLVEGDAQLDVEKTPNSAIAPGEVAPFRLEVTNSGTADLPGVVVRDLLPAGLTFDESFQGGTGFRIVDVQVPAGTEPIPTATFTTAAEDGRIAELRWSFGDWVMRPGTTFAIEIQVRLAPGVTEGQVSSNVVGVSSPVDELACASGTGTSVDGAFGTGTWCTDSAAVTTKAGAAFEARKWVAGNDALGWWNNRTLEPVAVGDPGCPSRTEAGRTYTAYPCVALVNPGDRFDYLLRMVNAGTEPATAMRAIDRFPVEGDNGVVLSGAERGTQWAERPTLASAPSLRGAGTLSTTYADSEAGVCTADLGMGNGCGPGTWSAPYSQDAVAAQMRVDWDTPLAPGEGVSIVFSMDAPLEVPRVTDPTIAWNSFGHAETTRRANGSSRVLPPTEPIQVGVAMAYGTLRVEKQLLENPGDLPVATRAFDIDYSCTIDPVGNPTQTVAEGTLSLRPGESADVTGIPGGAECRVWEADAHGGVTNHPLDDPAVVTIRPQLGPDPAPAARVTVTNSYPLAEVRVRKTVDGAAARFGAATTYPVEVTCAMDGVTAAGFPTTVELVGNDLETLRAPVGATCTASERDNGGATATAVSPAAGVLVVPGATAPLTLEVVNTFEQAHLQILKRITGAGASLPAGPFRYEVACTFEGTAIAPVAVEIPRSGADTELVADVPAVLPVGAVCTVSETDDGGADATPAPVTVTLVENADDNTVRATFTNEFSAATLSLAKTLAGEGATKPYATAATFTIDVTCAVDDPANVLHSAAVRIRGGEKVEIADADGDPLLLPLGARCWTDESDTGGASSHASNASSWNDAVVVAGGAPDQLQALGLEVTNTFDLAALDLTKVVTGDAAAYAAGRAYQVAVSCVLPQGGARTPILTAQPFTVTPGQPVRVPDLPVGAECWAEETDAGGATASVVSHPGQAAPALLAQQGAKIEVVNTFDAAQLTVAKRVVDGPAGPYSFEVTCTTARGPVELGKGDASFTLKDGQRREIAVPKGAECTVTEVDAPKAADVSFEEDASGSGKHDGTVVVDTQATVTVVNTFDTAEAGDDPAGDDVAGENAGTEPDGNGVIPNLGGPSLWLALLAGLLLAGGAVLLRRGRTAGRTEA
ncbi:DUF5979 domain-containing protein [Nocardioides sp. SYSU D00065]|uniref:DUF5979 domain-containing protein n=1 Tax=Nocardioides sp. SYSU D00065 TaxID=2817378 RepID=UPI001B34282D|nr:DUF5979 domain-containing protein [Nocardioides sp. SYSU D00065]